MSASADSRRVCPRNILRERGGGSDFGVGVEGSDVFSALKKGTALSREQLYPGIELFRKTLEAEASGLGFGMENACLSVRTTTKLSMV